MPPPILARHWECTDRSACPLITATVILLLIRRVSELTNTFIADFEHKNASKRVEVRLIDASTDAKFLARRRVGE